MTLIDPNILANLGVGAIGMWFMYRIVKDDLTQLRAENREQTGLLKRIVHRSKCVSEATK